MNDVLSLPSVRMWNPELEDYDGRTKNVKSEKSTAAAEFSSRD